MHEVHLTPKALAILSLLAQRAGQVVSKQELFDLVWPDTAVSDAALTSCIQELRHALGDEARQSRFLETVHRRGYRFVAKVALVGNIQPDETLPADEPLIGRDTSLKQMGTALAAAVAGTRQVIFLSGEAGIGKSALIEAFLAREKRRAALRTAGAVCVEQYGAVEAYRPLLEALTTLCKQPDGGRVTATLAQCAPTWLAQLPAIQPPSQFAALQRRTAGATRARMLRELTDALEALTADTTLILWLEDLHWADPSTLDWIAAFAKRRESARILLIGSFRGSGSAATDVLSDLVAELRVKGLCREIVLEGLTCDEIGAYFVRRLPPAPGSEPSITLLASQVHAQTEGNPFFAANVLADLVANGVLVEQDDGWSTRGELNQVILGVPDDVRRLIERQLARLEPQALELLEVASVVGLEGSAAAVAAGAGRDAGEVEGALARMTRQLRFIADAGTEKWPDGTVALRFRFRHSLYREVLRNRLTAARRAGLHARIGLQLEEAYGDRAGELAAGLAVHFEEGRDVRRAIVHLQQAARTAVRRSALEEAARSFGRALELVDTLPMSNERREYEITLRIGMGGVLMAAKGWGAADVERMYVRARELCRELGDTPQVFPALWGLWLFYWGRGSLQTARSLAENLLTLARTDGDPSRLLQAHHAMWATSFSSGEFQAAHEHAAAGIALYVREEHFALVTSYGNHDAAVCARMFDARALALLGETDAAVEAAEAGVSLARHLAHPFTLALALVLGAGVHQFRRDAQAVARYATEATGLCRDQSFPLLLAWGLTFQGWASVESGSYKEGAALIADGIARARATGTDQFLPHLLGLAADAELRTGSTDSTASLLDEALSVVARTGERFYEAELHRLSGEVVLVRRPKRPEDAADAFQRASTVARAQGAALLTLRTTVSLGRLRQRQGRLDEVKPLIQDARVHVAAAPDLLDLSEAAALLA